MNFKEEIERLEFLLNGGVPMTKEGLKLIAIAKAAKAYVDAPDGSVTFEHKAIVEALEALEKE